MYFFVPAIRATPEQDFAKLAAELDDSRQPSPEASQVRMWSLI